MADLKISDLAELAGAPASDDELEIRDVSVAAASQNKRIKWSNLVSALIPKSLLTTKGDIIAQSTVPARLGVGTNGQVLTANSSASTGLSWATPSTGVTGVSVEAYGAVPNSTGAATANVTAINAALQAENGVVFPFGNTYYVNSTLIVPTQTMIYLNGNVMVPSSASVFPESPDANGVPRNAGASVFFFKNPTAHFDGTNPNAQDRGFGGGIVGHGTIDSQGRAHYHVDVSSWHHADFRHFRSVNPLYAHFHCQPGIARTPQLGDWLDSDFHNLFHLDFAYNSNIFPKRGILCEDGGCNDSTIAFGNIVGLAPTTITGGVDQQSGGWGIEMKNCSRYKIVDTYTGDNTRCVSGGLLIKQDALGGAQTRNQQQNCQIDDFYVEGQADPIAGWRHAAIKIQMTSTGHQDATDIMIYRVKYAHTTATDNYWLWTINNHASRLIDGIEYTSPRGHLNANNNIILSTRTNNSLIEVRDAASVIAGSEAAFITNSGSSNFVRHSRSGVHNAL